MHVIPPAVPTSEAEPSHPTSSNFPATGAQMKPTDDFEEILRRVDRDLMSALGMNDEVMVKYLSGILAIYQQRMQTQELLRSLNSNERK
ncbi:hypothetical protein V9T40_012146 [Parthenolecanium corni]|uniref:Uncharacterized protein n=1 Tax=Parthenolecanium corni TaxID=536013 RepID=A0AAN9T901_9HEMI